MILFLINLLLAGLSILLYYNKPKRLILRIIPLLLLYLVFVNFTLTIHLKRRSLPVLLIDISESMSPYLNEVYETIKAVDFEYQQYFFSESLMQRLPASNVPLGKYTDLTSALLQVTEENPSSIILITDGNHNFGESPLSKIEYLTTPVYCFGVGAETLRDVAIVDVIYPEYAFANDSLTIEAVIESKGFEGGNGEIVLDIPFQKKTIKKSFPLSAVPAKNTVLFKILAQDIGTKRVRLSLRPESGETTDENNEQEFQLNILKKKIQVLYFTDHLSFNTKFILRALANFDNIHSLSLTRDAANNYLLLGKKYEPVANLPDLNQFDVLILDNIKFNQLPWPNLKGFLDEGKGILFIGSVEGITAEAQGLLPINITGSITKAEAKIEIVQPFSTLVPGKEYPPFSAVNRTVGIKANATVIARSNNLPLIAYAHEGRGTVFQINGLGIGNWHFSHLGSKNEDLLSSLLIDIIRFLSPLGKENRVVLKSLRNNYTLGQVINLRLETFDQDFKPQTGGDFYLAYNNEKKPFFELKPGIYEATFTCTEIGEFKVSAEGRLNSDTLRSNEISIKVTEKILESDQGINKRLLQEIAEQTNGSYFALNELGKFRPPKPAYYYQPKKIGIDSPIIYLIILIFFAFDWFLRRREGTV